MHEPVPVGAIPTTFNALEDASSERPNFASKESRSAGHIDSCIDVGVNFTVFSLVEAPLFFHFFLFIRSRVILAKCNPISLAEGMLSSDVMSDVRDFSSTLCAKSTDHGVEGSALRREAEEDSMRASLTASIFLDDVGCVAKCNAYYGGLPTGCEV